MPFSEDQVDAILNAARRGNIFILKELLGHTSLAIVNRYVALAQADSVTIIAVLTLFS